MNASKREHSAAPSTPHQGLQVFYNDETFSDVTVLMLGQRPHPSKAARKFVLPTYTFNAHKVVLSAGSPVFSEYFRDHPKDEDTGTVCKVDLEIFYHGWEPSAKINVAMLRYLYGLPLFPAATTGEPEQVVDVWTWHELCLVAGILKIAGLAAYALVELEEFFERKMEVDEKTGLLKDKANVDWFMKNVKSVRRCMDTNKRTDVIDMILKFCCRHFIELEPNESFQFLADTMPTLYRDMLRYNVRQKIVSSR